MPPNFTSPCNPPSGWTGSLWLLGQWGGGCVCGWVCLGMGVVSRVIREWLGFLGLGVYWWNYLGLGEFVSFTHPTHPFHPSIFPLIPIHLLTNPFFSHHPSIFPLTPTINLFFIHSSIYFFSHYTILYNTNRNIIIVALTP